MDEQEVPDKSSQGQEKEQPADSNDVTRRSVQGLDEQLDPTDGQDTAAADESVEADIGIKLSPEELPTMQWSDIEDQMAAFEAQQAAYDHEIEPPEGEEKIAEQAGPLGGLDDAMDWLEQLAAGQGMPIDEMPTLVSARPSEESIQSEFEENVVESGDDIPAAAPLPMDSDPMAWLEQLAVEQSSPLEELPSVADRLLASEIVSQTELPPDSTISGPYDVDQALTYLEQLAAAQGIDLSQVSFDAARPASSLDEALAVIDSLVLAGLAKAGPRPQVKIHEPEDSAEEVQEQATEEMAPVDQFTDLSRGMPDDPQQALDWLSEFDDEDVTSFEIVSEADTIGSEADIGVAKTGEDLAAIDSESAAIDLGQEESQFDADVLHKMPEDPDEAMAWMEDLAKGHPQNLDDESDLGQKSGAGLSDESPYATGTMGSEDMAATIARFESLLAEDGATDELLEELEDTVTHHSESPRLLRILGDAYMQKGEVEKAIETYRKGFDHL